MVIRSYGRWNANANGVDYKPIQMRMQMGMLSHGQQLWGGTLLATYR